MKSLAKMSTRVLFVAEKNDVAKSIANILSRGNASRKEGRSKFNKIYEFEGDVLGMRSSIASTSVSGHMKTIDFGPEYQNWESISTIELFNAPIKSFVIETMKNIEQTLGDWAVRCNTLIVWTDCDREGEKIGSEIAETCLRYNRKMDIYRARFSEVTPFAIRNALNNLTRLDQNVISAVECRSELDLRIGAAFTRLQTIYLNKRFGEMLMKWTGDSRSIISYGSCQFPTLGFVVDRYLMVKNFIPENFWKLRAFHLKNGVKTEFNWERGRLFYKPVVESYLVMCQDTISNAKIVSVDKNPKSKFRPIAMDTICLEKLSVRFLKMSAKQAMDLAEKLYSKGFISYPRTETNIFPKNLDLNALINKQKDGTLWGQFAQEILNNGGPNPRNGKKTDEAHPPIHPLALVTKEQLQNNDMFRLYELIVRHFLACCSRDAKGKETTVLMSIGEEMFKASGLQIEDRGFLEIYPYDKWSDKILPEYIVNEKVSENLEVDIHEGMTTAPPLLNEADLISLMDKYGIGTDATHAEHIETIQKRKYCSLNNDRRFVPSSLGLALVESYNNLGYQLSKPDLRSDLEKGLEAICKGEKTKNDVLLNQIYNYKNIFQTVENQINTFGDFFEDQVKNNNIPLNSIENNSSAYNRNRNVSADSTAGRRARGGKSRGNSNSTRPPAPTSKSVDSSSTTTSGTSNNQNLCEDVKCLCNKPSIILTCKHTIASYIFLALEGIAGNNSTTLLEVTDNDDNVNEKDRSIFLMDDKNSFADIIKDIGKHICKSEDHAENHDY
ncbi:DNA topoisomerase 3-alpha [Strongyloides ratti]|uniref:DNA topoisomerase n=1 Tax=Strongyloides ratti TaxID=34506 RepID=A0A090LCN1_STRRB|nr:DNA topoisomerase 3-alpha [Strongyloides ratti]CEF67527.1 DNA topoisomerase 3-alpha [Strongyloides ratti]